MSQPATILIVDDDAVARELLETHLASDGYRIEAASRGQEALEKAGRLRPDLVLLDVMMPQMNGFEVCRRLRADPALAEVPVIMITALDDSASKLEGIEAGADDFLSKPYDAHELRARVRTVTRLDRYRRLVDERAKFEWVVDQSDDGYLLLRTDDDRVVYANPKARAFFGLGREAELTEPFLVLATSRYRCEPHHLWKQWPDPPATPLFLLLPESPGTGALWLRVDLLALPSEKGVLLVRLRDQTSRMALGRNLFQFSSWVSEKLRTPLSMTLESLDMMAQETGRFSPQELERLVALARRSGQRLESQLRDVLTLLDEPDRARWEAGIELDRIEAFVAELAEAMRLAPITVHRDDGVEGRLPLSPMALELILREVFDNARQFHPTSSPKLTLRLALAGEGVRRQARFEIESDDSTADAEQLERFWIPYYQNEEDSSVDAEGMGLGISILGNLIWGVGGTCDITDREESGGVAVELLLPLV